MFPLKNLKLVSSKKILNYKRKSRYDPFYPNLSNFASKNLLKIEYCVKLFLFLGFLILNRSQKID